MFSESARVWLFWKQLTQSFQWLAVNSLSLRAGNLRAGGQGAFLARAAIFFSRAEKRPFRGRRHEIKPCVVEQYPLIAVASVRFWDTDIPPSQIGVNARTISSPLCLRWLPCKERRPPRQSWARKRHGQRFTWLMATPGIIVADRDAWTALTDDGASGEPHRDRRILMPGRANRAA
jgi:hypothetical protein